ncbi:uncharacterized protein LOC113324795 [Papaver somniferum]|uniref:uncharacterized protein LOC113324795 n=1 Tax=Papaver somniferum TaxID=3469 RepID=UPI000E7055AA|nr:uncharacterized protein LOC113324795 [Papaver somniferum]
MPSWQFVDNYNNDSFVRIWIGWDPSVAKVSILHSSTQCMFVLVDTYKDLSFVATFLYGDNNIIVRRSMWEDIVNFNQFNSKPWIILGDYNFILYSAEKTGGADIRPSHYQDLSNCVQDENLLDLPYSGCYYTWFNKQDDSRIGSKIDIIMVNMEWIDQIVDSKAEFLNPGISDHSPGLATIFEKRKHGPPPFRFVNFMTEEPDFLDLVRNVWKDKVGGNPMFVFMSKLRNAKDAIIKWKITRFKNLSEKVMEAKKEMFSVQQQVQANPLCPFLARKEKQVVQEYSKVARYEEYMKKQRPRVMWSSRMLQEVNSTFLTSVAKKENPNGVDDYRPIMLWGCLQVHCKNIVSKNEVSVEVFDPSLCTLKIDLRKAYDTVSWEAVLSTLRKMGFPALFIGWISLCISSPKNSILINGSPYGYFGASRGLRQGCPLSPYLFVMVMELLNDVLMFFKGNPQAAYNVNQGIIEFGECTGLQINQ